MVIVNYSISLTPIIMLIFCTILCTIDCTPPIWTSYPQFRIGQQALYQDPYFPLASNTTSTIVYTSALPSTSFNALFISGFQNFLTPQIYIQLYIKNVLNDRIIIQTYFDGQTYVKRLNVNYFVCKGSPNAILQISTKKYLTYTLANSTGYRQQPFELQILILPATATGVKHFITSISGLQLYNNDGDVNYLNVQTSITTANKIRHIVSVDQKNRLIDIKITTIVFYKYALFPNNLAEFVLKQSLSYLSNGITGFKMLNKIGNQGYFGIQNNIMIGMNGFNFIMQDSRIFILNILPQVDWTSNMFTNPQMASINVTFFFIAQFSCTGSDTKYHYEQFKCINNCTYLYETTTNNICYNCLNTCSKCLNAVNDCSDCDYVTHKRLLNLSATPKTCNCDYTNGYVDVGQPICGRCQLVISGCQKCLAKQSCDVCKAPTFIRVTNTTHPAYFTCACPNNQYLVSNLCLNYPGCIQANNVATGNQCLNCSQAKNFKATPSMTKKCDCKFGYYYNAFFDICQDNCGNGEVADGANKCDDGNQIGGDGCSDKCIVQFGYTCTSHVPNGISVCGIQQIISISYLYVSKTLDMNQAVLVFSLQPKQSFLPVQAFQNNYNTSIGSITRQIKFDPKKSLIYLTINYNKTIQDSNFMIKFSFAGLSIYSDQIQINNKLNGLNAKLEISDNPQMSNIIIYIGVTVGSISLVLALIAAFLGQKLIGIQLILPIQAAFFIVSTFPSQILSPVSALYSLKFSNGYNILTPFQYQSNYILSTKFNIMNYTSQFIQNYNLMFCLLTILLIIFVICSIRIALLKNNEQKIQIIQRQIQDKRLQQQNNKNFNKNNKNKQQDQQTDDNSKKQLPNNNKLSEELQKTRETIGNSKKIMYMIFDRLFTIIIVTSMQKVLFCFFLQFTNLIYQVQTYSNPINAAFCFMVILTIVIGLYSILYDYKTYKIIVFYSIKGKYAIFYILNFFVYITIIGSLYQAKTASYLVTIFSIIPFVLILYQRPYNIQKMQTVIALICQLPFIIMAILSILLNIMQNQISELICLVFVFLLLGSSSINIMLTVYRMIKVIDIKKLEFFNFTNSKQKRNQKKQKNNFKLLQLGQQKNWDQLSVDSVRQMIFQRQNIKDLDNNQNDNFDEINQIKQQKSDQYQKLSSSMPQNNKENKKTKQNKKQLSQTQQDNLLQENKQQQQQQDQQIGQLQKIKIKLRKQIKQKKAMLNAK